MKNFRSQTIAIPFSAGTSKIGIGITTQNRREVAMRSIMTTVALSPKNSKIVVVDDCSDVPFPELPGITVIRNEKILGVANSKNICLAHLRDCDYIFLLDDDIFPKTPYWCDNYIKASIRADVGHLMLIRAKPHSQQRDAGNKLLRRINLNGVSLTEWMHPSGTMLFINRQCFLTVGGFDHHYPRWGCEHVGWSYRAHNLGFSDPALWLDVTGSATLFYSFDFDAGIASTISKAEQKAMHVPADMILAKEKDQRKWKPYMPENFVLTALLSGVPDHQGRRDLQFNSQNDIAKWSASIARNRFTGIVFTNEAKIEATMHLKPVYVPTENDSPYQRRWKLWLDWLVENREMCGQVWCTDGTDVEMLSVPEIKPKTLYVGLDDNTYDCEWARRMGANYVPYRRKLETWPKQKLLNAGVVGGDVDTMIEFITDMVREFKNFKGVMPDTDMPQFNHIAEKYRPVYGYPVTTPFKEFSTDTKGYWWKHK